MTREDAIKTLKKIKDHASYLGSDSVDDPEDILADLAGMSDESVEALEMAIKSLEKEKK